MDLVNIVEKNIILNEMKVCKPTGQCILIKKGQNLSQMPYEYKVIVVKFITRQSDILTNQASLDQTAFTFNQVQFLKDFAVMEITDKAIGKFMQWERAKINEHDLRGIFDYGNISTWLKRTYKQTQPPKEN